MSETEHTKQKLNDRLLHVRLEGVGPITRSTMDPGRVDPEWEALSDLVYWCWCCRFQAARLQTSLLNEFTYWRKVRHVLAERAFAATSYDEHCLLVAATNLDRALGHSKALIGESPIPETTRRSLRLLRNLYDTGMSSVIPLGREVPRSVGRRRRFQRSSQTLSRGL